MFLTIALVYLSSLLCSILLHKHTTAYIVFFFCFFFFCWNSLLSYYFLKLSTRRTNVLFLPGNELTAIIFGNTFNRVPDGQVKNNSLSNYSLFPWTMPGYRISGDYEIDYYKLDFLIHPYLHKDTNYHSSILDDC